MAAVFDKLEERGVKTAPVDPPTAGPKFLAVDEKRHVLFISWHHIARVQLTID